MNLSKFLFENKIPIIIILIMLLMVAGVSLSTIKYVEEKTYKPWMKIVIIKLREKENTGFRYDKHILPTGDRYESVRKCYKSHPSGSSSLKMHEHYFFDEGVYRVSYACVRVGKKRITPEELF